MHASPSADTWRFQYCHAHKLSQHWTLTSAAWNSALALIVAIFPVRSLKSVSTEQPTIFQWGRSRYSLSASLQEQNINKKSFFNLNVEVFVKKKKKKISRTEKVTDIEGISRRLRQSMSMASCSPCRLVETVWFHDTKKEQAFDSRENELQGALSHASGGKVVCFCAQKKEKMKEAAWRETMHGLSSGGVRSLLSSLLSLSLPLSLSLFLSFFHSLSLSGSLFLSLNRYTHRHCRVNESSQCPS